MAMLKNQMVYFNHCWILCTQVTSSDLALRGFVAGDTVVAARDLRVRGKVVVRQARVGPVGPLPRPGQPGYIPCRGSSTVTLVGSDVDSTSP